MTCRSKLLLAVALVGGCSAQKVPSQSSSDGAPAAMPNMASVFVARAKSPPQESMLGRMEGKFVIEHGCLVIKSDATTYLPIFAAAGDVQLRGNAVFIDGQATELGRVRFFGGGEPGQGFDKYLVRPVPVECSSNRFWKLY